MRSLIAIVALAASSALAAPCVELPVLFIVQDKSGSMNFAPDGTTASTTNPSKWSIARQVVPALASNFNNRFRFGAAMYPQSTTTFNCTTGTVVTPIADTTTGITSAYNTAVPGGGTPTAASLLAVRSHLLGQGLTTPAYVLLITDGLPNCNTSLDPNACSPTTPGCGPTPATSTCALGSKDCLDNNATVSAAQQLFAANIKVFVVGFDNALTAGNNKAVLDAIASAGGTGSAYVANSQAQLTSTLNTIAASTATCCKDVCTAGAAVCSGTGARSVCQMDTAIGCTTWTTQQCNTGSTCSNGSCQACTNTCTAGAVRCANGDAQQCVANAQGCTSWQTAEVCGYGEVCAGGSCNSCQGCAMGASRCTATGVETCEWSVLSGCTQWSARACASGSTCQAGSCTSCNTTCTAGAQRCAGNTVQSCVANAAGCTSWQNGQTCTNFCSGGACGTCGTTCTAGQTRCQGASGVETCIVDANNCPAWGPTQQCAPNNFCESGVCNMCATSCTQGSKRCGANGATEECRLDPMGCTAFVATGQCDVGAGERCDTGVCIPPCQNACTPGAGQCRNGRPESCQQGPTGCFIWRDEPVCGMEQQCVSGTCRTVCASDEFETCPQGEVCTGLTEGRFCLPVDPDGGTGGGLGGGAGGGSGGGTGGLDAGSGTGGGSNSNGSGEETTPGGPSRIGAVAMGCNCNSVDAGLLPLLALGLTLLRRRSRK
ncbi:MAG: VWA domain-containing protein [Archangium sp.]|nr:VWA domain-containing protein [Archangium sp.]